MAYSFVLGFVMLVACHHINALPSQGKHPNMLIHEELKEIQLHDKNQPHLEMFSDVYPPVTNRLDKNVRTRIGRALTTQHDSSASVSVESDEITKKLVNDIDKAMQELQTLQKMLDEMNTKISKAIADSENYTIETSLKKTEIRRIRAASTKKESESNSVESAETVEDTGKKLISDLEETVALSQKLQERIKSMQARIEKVLDETKDEKSTASPPSRSKRSEQVRNDLRDPDPIDEEIEDLHQLRQRVQKLTKKVNRNLDENKAKRKPVYEE